MNTFPINLLLKDKKCLIVGGGKVANRKLSRLISSNANITMVATKFSNGVLEQAKNHSVKLLERKFNIETDFDEIYLAYFATDDFALNRELMELAKAKKIICCSVDSNWENSDFTTPATIQQNDITISISGSGKSCRKTKLVRENIERHIETIEATELVVIGTDHNYISIKEREKLHINANNADEVAKKLTHIWGIQGFMLLNTCNRVEFIGAAKASSTVIEMIELVMRFNNLSRDKYYIKTGYEAFKHICFTTSGLYSQIYGENHISAQFKDSCANALEKNYGGSLIQALAENIIHVSRQIRTAIAPVIKSYDFDDLAIKYIQDRDKLTAFDNKKVMVIGTGIIGNAVIKKLQNYENCEIIAVYYSKKVAETHNLKGVQLANLSSYLPKVDYIISAISSDEPIIHDEHIKSINDHAVIVDLGLPRNVEFSKRDNNFHSIDIEDLKYWYRKNMCDVELLHSLGNKVIEDYKEIYEKFKRSFIDGRQG